MCFRQLFSTYTSAFRTSRGVRRMRAWYLSAHTRPFRRKTRLTAFATRTARPRTPREGRRLGRFYEQVQMIGLNAVLEDAKARSGCRGQCDPNCRYDASASEGERDWTRADRDMGGTARLVGSPSAMCNVAPPGTRLS